ncbi:perforin-1-like [Conger conger]|uniref:perforin-1-like n=1 Tax=Conger conger TaxID=82655 RepID=UPI002A5AEACD|nr:perforin-1-like [Conger conger]
MEGLWRLLIAGCACHFLSSACAFGVGTAGSPAQCKRAEFVPGHNLAGEGLDIVTMQRKGAYVVDLEKWGSANGSCTLVRNRYQSNRLQKLPTAVVHWRSLGNCRKGVTSKRYESSESLVEDATSSAQTSWKIGLGIRGVAGISVGGTHSRVATFASRKSRRDKYSFVSQEVHCSFYRYRLAAELPLHAEFQGVIRRLQKRRSSSDFEQLIATYGTHYIVEVRLGGRAKDVTAIRTCQAAMMGLSVTEVMDCLEVEASGTYKSVTLRAEARHCRRDSRRMQNRQSFRSMFREHHSEVVGGEHGSNLLFSKNPRSYLYWMNSLKAKPDIVLYTARPLFFLLPQQHPARQGLRTAIRSYIMRNALVRKCSGSCRGRRSSRRDPCACVCRSDGRITGSCCPRRPGLAKLSVYGLYARKLYGDVMTQTDGSVLVRYGGRAGRTEIIPNNDNPRWRKTFRFGPVVLNMGTRLKFEVYDEDRRWNSDLLGRCSVAPRQGTVSDSCMFKYGTFFFTYRVTCAPSLGGNRCQEYIPSPMRRSLAKTYYSRNGFLAGERWEAVLAGNHSQLAGLGSGFEDRSGE